MKNYLVIRRSVLAAAGFFLLLQSTPKLFAQVDTGTILGTVTDEAGGVIPNATVMLVNEATNYKITKKTGPDGSYIFTPVRLGSYTVTASDPGFQKSTHTHVIVNIQQQTVVNMTMVPGKVTQTIEVTAALPLLQTQNASVQQVVNSKEINQLPLNGRNATFLAQIAAGVTPSHDAGRGLVASGSFSANGARSLQNNYMLDGIDDNAEIGDLINRSAYVLLPPPDALNEFTVQTNSYSAEFGHSAGAVLNATTKSGTNHVHGDLWEFLRNDKLDATPFFLNEAGASKAEYRQNQFGFTLGGPVVIPHVYNGHNKTFFFGWYQGTRIRQGSTTVTTVPTLAERNSGYTNFQDLIAGQSGTRKDILGRTFPLGTIMDPATTRAVTAGQVDPVTGLVAPKTGFVRDPFFKGSLVGARDFTTPAAESLLNLISTGRLDPNAIKLLNLYPKPTGPSLFSNYTTAPINHDDNDQGGIRVDENFSEKDTAFFRYILSDTTNAFPGPFPGLADGQPNRPGSGTTKAQNWALSETHIFSPSLVNEARVGYSRLHDVRLQFKGNDLSNIPATFGILGIPQVPENGGLPRITISTLGNLGTAQYLPSNKWSNTFQATDNLTKIAGHHTIKMGAEFQNIRYPMLSAGNSRGQFGYNGVYTSVVNEGDGSTARGQFLLTPISATVPGGIDNVGGMNSLIATTLFPNPDLHRNYYALYFEDHWRTAPKLTLNIGARWDYFGRPAERYHAMSNFVPGLGFQGGTLLFPASRVKEVPQAYIDQLALDGIAFQTTASDSAGVTSPAKDFGPRFGFAYHPLKRVVLRGGYAIFYSGFETLGLSSLQADNFPFSIKSSYNNPNPVTPLTPDNSIGGLENGLLNVPLTAAAAASNLSGVPLQGAQRHWKDEASQNFNLFLQYQLTKNTTVKAGYVGSQTRHALDTIASNTIATMLPPGTNVQKHAFYPHFARGGTIQWAAGNRHYNGLQLNLEHRSGGLFMLANFSLGDCRTNSNENLIAGTSGQAPYLYGFGPQYNTCVDGGVRRVFHYSGVYDLPFGNGRRFLNHSGVVNAVLGGWSINWILTVQDGNPFTIGCNVSTTAGLGCNAFMVPGEKLYTGEAPPDHPFLNAAAFANPPVATAIGQTDYSPLGGEGTQAAGPPFRNLDFSLFKTFPITESTHLQFRAEAFNLSNTPSFSIPAFDNFSDTKNFGKITSTVSNPREIQFALKFLF